jgi:hypothetical protein
LPITSLITGFRQGAGFFICPAKPANWITADYIILIMPAADMPAADNIIIILSAFLKSDRT